MNLQKSMTLYILTLKNYELLFLLQLILEFPPLSSILREMEESSESHIMDTLKGMHN